MPIALKGTTSGQVTLTVPAVAGSGTLTLPTTTDTVATLTSNTFVTPTLTSPIVSGNLTLNGSSSGTIAVAAPATASGTVTFPAGTGTIAVQGVSTNLVQSTAQATTSGTSFLFPGIPSWAKRITVVFNGTNTSATNSFLVQIGSGSVTTTGYVSSSNFAGATTAGPNSTSGFIINRNGATAVSGIMTIYNVSGNIYVSSNACGFGGTGYAMVGGGTVTLSGALDRVNITSTTGTDTFNAGSINIVWE